MRKKKTFENLKKEYEGNYSDQKNNMSGIKNQVMARHKEYDDRVSVINSIRHMLREELEKLRELLKEIGEIGEDVTSFDFATESPKPVGFNFELKKSDLKPLRFWHKKSDLLDRETIIKNDYLEWDKQIKDANGQVKFYETAAEVADLYRATIDGVHETLKKKIIPEVDGVCAFLKAYAVKDAINADDDPNAALSMEISIFKGTPYEKHQVFIKNTVDYYQLVKEMYTKTVITALVESSTFTEQKKEDFCSENKKINEKNTLLGEMTSFGG